MALIDISEPQVIAEHRIDISSRQLERLQRLSEGLPGFFLAIFGEIFRRTDEPLKRAAVEHRFPRHGKVVSSVQVLADIPNSNERLSVVAAARAVNRRLLTAIRGEAMALLSHGDERACTVLLDEVGDLATAPRRLLLGAARLLVHVEIAKESITTRALCSGDSVPDRRERSFGYAAGAAIACAVFDPGRSLTKLEIFGKVDATALFGAETPSPQWPNESIVSMVERQANETPNSIAYVHGAKKITYAQADGLANAFAARLLEAGVRRGELVPVLAQYGVELPVALLGTMKAGAAFVPLDPFWPAVYISDAIGKVRPQRLIDTTRGSESTPVIGAERIVCDLSDLCHDHPPPKSPLTREI